MLEPIRRQIKFIQRISIEGVPKPLNIDILVHIRTFIEGKTLPSLEQLYVAINTMGQD